MWETKGRNMRFCVVDCGEIFQDKFFSCTHLFSVFFF